MYYSGGFLDGRKKKKKIRRQPASWPRIESENLEHEAAQLQVVLTKTA
jgi:hypothetical protein